MAFCEGVHPFPHDCKVDEPIDRTDGITGKNQVPLMLIHGTEDTVTPYVNGKAAFYQAQEVGLPSALITTLCKVHITFHGKKSGLQSTSLPFYTHYVKHHRWP